MAETEFKEFESAQTKGFPDNLEPGNYETWSFFWVFLLVLVFHCDDDTQKSMMPQNKLLSYEFVIQIPSHVSLSSSHL